MYSSFPIAALSPAMQRGLVTLAFALALLAAFWRAPQSAPAAFVPPVAAAPSALPAIQQAAMLPGVGEIAGTPSLTRLADGRVAAAWLSGREGKREQAAIWFSTLDNRGWSEPQAVATREQTAGSIFAHIRQIADPVLYQHGKTLHLWHTATAIGGHVGQTIIHRSSDDGGLNWSKPVRVQASPFGNNGLLLKSPPLALADGGLGLPISQQLLSRHGEWLRLAADGQVLDKARLALAVPALQPAVVALDENRALALLRDGAARQVRATASGNGGQSWQGIEIAELANPDTPIALLQLPDGRLLLAGNTATGRGTLALWVTKRDGISWRQARIVETAADGAADFSEPTLLLAPDGWIHLAYGWRQQGIRHMRFSEAWLDGDAE
jgi:predicted neuraminidase